MKAEWKRVVDLAVLRARLAVEMRARGGLNIALRLPRVAWSVRPIQGDGQ